MDSELKELSSDVNLITSVKQFRNATDNIASILKPVANKELYKTLSNADKVKYNLLMSYGMNALFWMYLRAEGIDPSSHRIKVENERLKQSMARWQRIKDRKTIMPRVDKKVAGRFVRSSLWTPVESTVNNQTKEADRDQSSSTDQPQATSSDVPATS